MKMPKVICALFHFGHFCKWKCHGVEPEVLPRAEQSAPNASPVDTDAAAALAKLLADPSMATLIKNLAKNL